MVTSAALFSFFQKGLVPLGLLPSSLRLEAKELAAFAAGIPKTKFFIGEGQALPPETAVLAENLLQRRLSGEPLAYILGAWDFYGYTFALNESCLIPRADSETIVGAAFAFAAENNISPAVLDLCCGSGCLGISLALELQKKQYSPALTLADISPSALAMAKQNAAALGVAPPPHIWQTDALRPPPAGKAPFDILLFNPPYLRKDELAGPYRALTEFEPALALDGGADGLDFYRALAKFWLALLAPLGAVFCEIGIGQETTVAAILEQAGLSVWVLPDLTGINRVVLGRRKG